MTKKNQINIDPQNESQNAYIKACEKCTIVISESAAGTGKSFVATTMALKMLMEKNNGIETIVFTKPLTQTGAKDRIGYLKGPQPLDSKIATPNGWSTMGELKVGDYVIGSDGKPTMIISTTDECIMDTYIVETNQGTCVVSSNHLFSTKTRKESHSPSKKNTEYKIRAIEEILDTIDEEHCLPDNPIIEYDNKYNLPILPYTLGALIGDGSFGGTTSPCFYSVDKDIMSRVIDEINNNIEDIDYKIYDKESKLQMCKFSSKSKKSGIVSHRVLHEGIIYNDMNEFIKESGFSRSHAYKIVKDNPDSKYIKNSDRQTINNLTNELMNLELWGKTCYYKFIPDVYKFSSIEDRLELLRGLMDTDGFTRTDRCENGFTTSSERLANDVCHIVKSLGGKAKISTNKNIGQVVNQDLNIIRRSNSYMVRISFKNGINPFYCKRKYDNFKNNYFTKTTKILKITPHKKLMSKCITVENIDGLYITNNFIVTHNSLNEKVQPFIQNLIDVIDSHLGNGQADLLIESGKIKIIPLELSRGRDLKNSIVVFDEAQNADEVAFKCLLTRIGNNSKLFISGSLTQIDLKEDKYVKSGLTQFIKMLYSNNYEEIDFFYSKDKNIDYNRINRDRPSIALIEFSKDDIVRSEICKRIEKIYDKKI